MLAMPMVSSELIGVCRLLLTCLNQDGSRPSIEYARMLREPLRIWPGSHA